MGEGDFAVVEHDYRDVLERHAGSLLLLDGEGVMIPLELGGAGDDDATPGHGLSLVEQGRCCRGHRHAVSRMTRQHRFAA